MMGGNWFKDHFGEKPDEKSLLEVAINHVRKTFPTNESPITSHVSILKDCIPQYVVGKSLDKLKR